jgi:hypothetical protein
MFMRTLLAATVAVLIASPAFAAECPKLMKAYDDAAKANASKVTAEATKLRTDGEADHKAGKHADSVTKLKKAMGIVGAKM